MHLQEPERLKELLAELQKYNSPPGLFHVTRIRFDLRDVPDELEQGWADFVGDAALVELSRDEVRCGLIQQSAYYGNTGKLEDYTGLAAETLLCFPGGTSPVVFHHRDARIDRNQWTLGFYGRWGEPTWGGAIDLKGRGAYAQLDLGDDAIHVLRGRNADLNKLRGFLTSWEESLRYHGISPPEYIYAAIVTDLFRASILAIEAHLKQIDEGFFDLPPGALLPVDVAQTLKNETADGEQDRPTNGSGNPQSVTDEDERWPPDDGWRFRPGEFAFGGGQGKISGKAAKLLQRLAKARRALTLDDLRTDVWGDDDCSDGNIRTHLTKVRDALRGAFRLRKEVDPVPCIARGEGSAAWQLDQSVLSAHTSE